MSFNPTTWQDVNGSINVAGFYVFGLFKFDVNIPVSVISTFFEGG
jgi:hypothetical protein